MCKACWQAHDLTIQSVVEPEVCASQVLVDIDGAVVAKIQWIGLRENLQESPIFHGKIMENNSGFL